MNSSYFLLIKVLGSLVLVLTTFFVLVWYLKRNVLPASESGALRLRGHLNLAPQSQLLLVEAVGRLYLIGYSEKGFTVIDNLGEEGLQLVAEEVEVLAQGEESKVDSEVISQLLRLDRLRHQRKAER